MTEQRTEPRRKVQLAIYYGTDKHQLMTNYSVNMSTGGIFIETALVLPVDTSLFVEFMLPGNDIKISCKAKVAWTNEPENLKSPSLPPGMGLQFLNLSLKNIGAIRDFITESGIAPVW